MKGKDDDQGFYIKTPFKYFIAFDLQWLYKVPVHHSLGSGATDLISS